MGRKDVRRKGGREIMKVLVKGRTGELAAVGSTASLSRKDGVFQGGQLQLGR